MNTILAVRDHAITEATDLETEGRDLIKRGHALLQRAATIRAMHAVQATEPEPGEGKPS